MNIWKADIGPMASLLVAYILVEYARSSRLALGPISTPQMFNLFPYGPLGFDLGQFLELFRFEYPDMVVHITDHLQPS